MGEVVRFPGRPREVGADEIFDRDGNVRVGPGRVVSYGQASVTLPQAAAGLAHGWRVVPGTESAGRVLIARDWPGPGHGEPGPA